MIGGINACLINGDLFFEIMLLHEKGLHINMYLFHVAANMQTNIFLLKQLAVEL